MTKRAAKSLVAKMNNAEPISIEEVEKAIQKIISIIFRLIENNEIAISRFKDDENME